MIVGFHSPLPPARTGVADYAADLIRALSRQAEILPGAREADVHLCHLGNNGLHAPAYGQALERPGVVVLHDAVLHHFLLGRLSREAYVEEFVYNYGEWHRGTAKELWEGRAQSASRPAYFRYPMLRRVVERSRAVIVHNPAAARMAREHVPGARIEEAPHLWTEPEPATAGELRELRERLKIPAASFVFGVFGHLRETKRLPAVLRAFQRARRQGREMTLLVAGRFASQDLERSLGPALSEAGVVRVGWSDARGFRLLAAMVDACINLRDPAAGETSGVTVRLMGLGKPVIVTESEETSPFPEGACARIGPGVAEEEELRHYMILLASNSRAAAEMGRLGAAYIREHHGVAKAAAVYWKVLCECCDKHC